MREWKRNSVEITEEDLKRELFVQGKRAGYKNSPAASQHEIYMSGWQEGQSERLREASGQNPPKA